MHDPLPPGQPPGSQPPAGPQSFPNHLVPDNHFGTHQAAAQHFGVAQIQTEDDGWGKIGIVMVALAVVFAGGVAYFIATSGSGADETKVAASEIAEDELASAAAGASDAGAAATEPAAAEPAEAEPAETETEPAAAVELADAGAAAEPEAVTPEPVGGTIGLLRENGEIDRPAGLVSLAIESEPAGATVIRKRDGVRLGVTPYRYETESERGDVAFLLKLDGYRTTSVSMPGNKDSVRQVMLLPGSGGAVVPAAPAETEPKSETPAEPKKPVVAAKPKKPAKPKAASKPKRAPKPKRPAKPKAPSKPKKKGGKVDYQADPIPL